MNLVRCSIGHFYDSDKFDYCPHCFSDKTSEKSRNILPYNDRLCLIRKSVFGNSEIDILADEIFMGSFSDYSTIFVDSAKVQKKQAVIHYKDEKWYIKNLYEYTAVFLNGTRLETENDYILNENDEIDFAHSEIFVVKSTKNIIDGEYTYCTKCGKKIENKTINCPYCSAYQSEIKPYTTSLICSSCKGSCVWGDDFCRNCGRPLSLKNISDEYIYYICIYKKSAVSFFSKNLLMICCQKNCIMEQCETTITIGHQRIRFSIDMDNHNQMKIVMESLQNNRIGLNDVLFKETNNIIFEFNKEIPLIIDKFDDLKLFISKTPINPELFGDGFIKANEQEYYSKKDLKFALSFCVEKLNEYNNELDKNSININELFKFFDCGGSSLTAKTSLLHSEFDDIPIISDRN